MKGKGPNGAFSLVELLIVISIIGVPSTILVPSVAGARHLARSAKCLSTLNALGRTMGTYHAENKESFWPCTMLNYPQPGVTPYFWGTKDRSGEMPPPPYTTRPFEV